MKEFSYLGTAILLAQVFLPRIGFAEPLVQPNLCVGSSDPNCVNVMISDLVNFNAMGTSPDAQTRVILPQANALSSSLNCNPVTGAPQQSYGYGGAAWVYNPSVPYGGGGYGAGTILEGYATQPVSPGSLTFFSNAGGATGADDGECSYVSGGGAPPASFYSSATAYKTTFQADVCINDPNNIQFNMIFPNVGANFANYFHPGNGGTSPLHRILNAHRAAFPVAFDLTNQAFQEIDPMNPAQLTTYSSAGIFLFNVAGSTCTGAPGSCVATTSYTVTEGYLNVPYATWNNWATNWLATHPAGQAVSVTIASEGIPGTGSSGLLSGHGFIAAHVCMH